MPDEKVSLTVHFGNLTVAQAIALDAMFHMYESLGQQGRSRTVAFDVDGDGDFRPTVQVVYSQKPSWLELMLREHALVVDDRHTPIPDRPIADLVFAYGGIGSELHCRNKLRVQSLSSNRECAERAAPVEGEQRDADGESN